MSSTNQAFIKAYRHDAARETTPAPARVGRATYSSFTPARSQAALAVPVAPASTVEPMAPNLAVAWQPTIEIVTPDYAAAYVAPDLPRHAPAVRAENFPLLRQEGTSAPGPVIGKRPLSSFTPRPTIETPIAEAVFTPETNIASFRWPRVCRTLWEQYGDQYERVADKLLAKYRDGRSLVGVLGLHPGDGCTTTLLCLAIALATRKERVILVDADFRAPNLANLLGVEPTTGWQDVLAQGIPVAEAVIHATRDQVDLLPLDAVGSKRLSRGASQLAGGLQTSVTAGVLRYAYDMVLVDLGALLAPKSFAAIDPLVRNMRIDAAIVVTNPHQAAHDDLILAEELLDESDCELLGVVENRTAKPQSAPDN